MRIIKIDPQEDREAWLDFRRDKISGTRVSKIKPMARGGTPEGFWQMVADRIALPKDGEPEMDRGLRLEQESCKATAKRYKLKLDYKPGVWVSDLDENIMVTPDASEDSKKPKYAVETKSLDTKNHIRIVLMDIQAKKQSDYMAFDHVPKDFQFQVLQYFVVNEHLKTLYFSLYDDRIVLDHLVHHVIKVDRADVEELIISQQEMEQQVLRDLNNIIKELKNVR